MNRDFAALLCLLTLPTTAACAGEGLYFGVEGAANFELAQTLRQGGSETGRLHFDTGEQGGLVIGGTFGSGLRPELELAYRNNDLRPLDSGRQETITAMVNLWF